MREGNSTHQQIDVTPSSNENDTSPRSRGLSLRVVLLCLALAVFFGYVIPIVDVKLSNTFVGAQHLPPGAVGVLLVMLLILNPLLRFLSRAPSSRRFAFSRNEILTVYISCLFSTLVPGHGGETFSSRSCWHRSTARRARIDGSIFGANNCRRG